MSTRHALVVALAAALTAASAGSAGGAAGGIASADHLVSVGSPSGDSARNVQNEPAVAMDAHDPNVLVAGSNDLIDTQVCPHMFVLRAASCAPLALQPVGISGVYFSFDRGRHWTQPTYTGWTARNCGSQRACAGYVGSIGRVPWYYESGLGDLGGDPGVAIGPRPVNGRFSWANGSRVYYSDLALNFPGHSPLHTVVAVAVSRLDNPTPRRVREKSSWMRPVIPTAHVKGTEFEDKDQIWADNAASSPFFGHVYTCVGETKANGLGLPRLTLSASADGGTTWRTAQIATNRLAGHTTKGWSVTSCTVRTDSHGVVYVFAQGAGDPRLTGKLPMRSSHVLIKSFDGGVHWTRPRTLFWQTDPCYRLDVLVSACVMDGYEGARLNLSGEPSVDIANGAPTGAGATNAIIDAWADGSAGLNHEQARIAFSTDGGHSWHDRSSVSLPGDRPMYVAPALSPTGDRAYVVYEALTSPWRGNDMSLPRLYHGVMLSARVGSGGPHAWKTTYAGPTGDLRGTFMGIDLDQEFVGDYVYAAASRRYGIGLWTDARGAAVCPAIQNWRADSLRVGKPVIPAVSPLPLCPRFGNTDIRAAMTR